MPNIPQIVNRKYLSEYVKKSLLLCRRQREYGKKELAEIQKGIRNVMRQVTATVTFLPLLDARCAFDLRIYLAKKAEVATGWVEETDTMIENPEKVQLRSFSTSIHRVNATVTYKADA